MERWRQQNDSLVNGYLKDYAGLEGGEPMSTPNTTLHDAIEYRLSSYHLESERSVQHVSVSAILKASFQVPSLMGSCTLGQTRFAHEPASANACWLARHRFAAASVWHLPCPHGESPVHCSDSLAFRADNTVVKVPTACWDNPADAAFIAAHKLQGIASQCQCCSSATCIMSVIMLTPIGTGAAGLFSHFVERANASAVHLLHTPLISVMSSC